MDLGPLKDLSSLEWKVIGFITFVTWMITMAAVRAANSKVKRRACVWCGRVYEGESVYCSRKCHVEDAGLM
tara:strand:- start:795 stop:1007 length:213 start_codon:yes stop_codon:yes gene_type:complete